MHIPLGRLLQLAAQRQFNRFAAYMGMQPEPCDPLYGSGGYYSSPSAHSDSVSGDLSPVPYHNALPHAAATLQLVRLVCCPRCNAPYSFAAIGVAGITACCRTAPCNTCLLEMVVRAGAVWLLQHAFHS